LKFATNTYRLQFIERRTQQISGYNLDSTDRCCLTTEAGLNVVAALSEKAHNTGAIQVFPLAGIMIRIIANAIYELLRYGAFWCRLHNYMHS
jgi:hypothetical protein